jgi:hypothetical protein
MKRYRNLITVMLTAMALIAGCTSSDETADETATAPSVTTVAAPETATTTSTTLSLTAAIATAEALHQAFNASDPDAALALFADGAFDGGLLPGSAAWEEAFAGAAAAQGRRSTLSDCEATDSTLTCLETWERPNLSGKAGVIRVHEWSFRFDDQGLITNHKGESVSGYDDDRAFEAALGTWMATAHPGSYEVFYEPTVGGLKMENWSTPEGVAELSPLIDEFVAQSDEYPLGGRSK